LSSALTLRLRVTPAPLSIGITQDSIVASIGRFAYGAFTFGYTLTMAFCSCDIGELNLFLDWVGCVRKECILFKNHVMGVWLSLEIIS
jgi:hypothetical protein